MSSEFVFREKTSGPKRSSAVFIGKMKTSHQRKPIVPVSVLS